MARADLRLIICIEVNGAEKKNILGIGGAPQFATKNIATDALGLVRLQVRS